MPCFCSLSLPSVPLRHSHSAHLGRRLGGSPDPAAARYPPTHCERPAVASLCRQAVCWSRSVPPAEPHLVFQSLVSPHPWTWVVVVFFVFLYLRYSVTCPCSCFLKSVFTDLCMWCSVLLCFGSGLWLHNPSQIYFRNTASPFLARLEAQGQKRPPSAVSSQVRRERR